MTRRIIKLGPGQCSDLETVARFFASLAFPGPKEMAAWHNAVSAWCGAYLHQANLIDHSTEPFQDARFNEFVQLPFASCKAQIRTLKRRQRDRYAAARAVRPWVQPWLNLKARPLPGVSKFTQRQIALYICQNDPERAANFQKRVLRPSRPVLHLAIATDLRRQDNQTSEELDLASIDLIREIVEIADVVLQLMRQNARFGRHVREVLELEWVP